jgi:hypothetical protein
VFVCGGLVSEFVMAVCEFNELNCECEFGGKCYRCLCWFGALIMHKKSGLSLVWHWHVFVCMCSERANPGLFVLMDYFLGGPHWLA